MPSKVAEVVVVSAYPDHQIFICRSFKAKAKLSVGGAEVLPVCVEWSLPFISMQSAKRTLDSPAYLSVMVQPKPHLKGRHRIVQADKGLDNMIIRLLKVLLQYILHGFG